MSSLFWVCRVQQDHDALEWGSLDVQQCPPDCGEWYSGPAAQFSYADPTQVCSDQSCCFVGVGREAQHPASVPPGGTLVKRLCVASEPFSSCGGLASWAPDRPLEVSVVSGSVSARACPGRQDLRGALIHGRRWTLRALMGLAWSDSFAFSLGDARGLVKQIMRLLAAYASGSCGGPFPLFPGCAGSTPPGRSAAAVGGLRGQKLWGRWHGCRRIPPWRAAVAIVA